MTPLTDAELARLEELARKATPGPWANTDTVHSLFGHYANDWWSIYAKDTAYDCPSIIVCSMSHHASEEEKDKAREVSWRDRSKIYDPGQSGHNARYIAAACNAVPLLVAEVRRLRAENEQMKHGMTAAYMVGKADEGDLQAENAALRERVEALEWLREVDSLRSSRWTFRLHGAAMFELENTYDAAREAI